MQFIFGRFAEIDALDPAFEDEPFDCDDAEFMDLFGHTMRHAGELTAYPDDQVARGLQYLLNNSFSNLAFRIQKTAAPVERHAEAIEAMRYLYSDCFEPRCASMLLPRLRRREPTALDDICFMLWDVSPVLSLAGKRPPGAALFRVLESALHCKNAACVESALHGLGHLPSGHEERRVEIIDRFLERRKYLEPELRAFALQARRGAIQ